MFVYTYVLISVHTFLIPDMGGDGGGDRGVAEGNERWQNLVFTSNAFILC